MEAQLHFSKHYAMTLPLFVLGQTWILEVLQTTRRGCCSVTPYSSSSLTVGYLGCEEPNKMGKNSICPYVNANCCHF